MPVVLRPAAAHLAVLMNQSFKETHCQNSILKLSSPKNPITGCMQRASFIFRSKRGIIPGAMIQFTYLELDLVTNKFSSSNLIGLGGSSHVYRGQHKDGKTVAVKRLKTQGGPEADSIFITEVHIKGNVFSIS
ncbi:Receptor-like serine/threonine-protein kinase NCRK [Thalictrum thalictroides]|uniref:Receptor-like serine/threonine-protein kinase NCRK n=1 Tax=Thalictrum thalictroides TaxID=46969 RepID=A0A7J6WK44_THATH|nr:Receptor-like serine/threonine-protein kinase NCRK [Thalictrum thalictroides]